ncbi:unnamed protein product [Caenorhabditis brenneri]
MISEFDETSHNHRSLMPEDPMEEILRKLEFLPANMSCRTRQLISAIQTEAASGNRHFLGELPCCIPIYRGKQSADEDQDEVPNLLLDMPEEPMKEILGNLDFIAVQTLRKVCHPIRNFIDEQNIDPKFPNLFVKFGPNEIKLSTYQESSVFCDGTQFRYKNARRGTGTKVVQRMFESFREYEKRGKILKDTNFVDIFCQDFQILTENSKTIPCFLFYFEPYRFPEEFIQKFQNILKIRNFETAHLHFEVYDTCQILPFLPLFDAHFLKSLTIVEGYRMRTTLEMEEIKVLEQWKKLEEVRIENFNVGDSKIFTHLTMGSASVSTMTADDINHLLQFFRHSPNLSKMKFEFPVSEKRQIVETLGDDYIEDIDNPNIHEWTRQWLFRMPNEDNYVLKVEVYSLFVVFTRLERKYVSADRVVKE